MATDSRSNSNSKSEGVGSPSPASGRQQSPEWAAGLRRLYDAVVEEPLPDSFAELLDKLDDRDG
jgi:hypothetical protein